MGLINKSINRVYSSTQLTIETLNFPEKTKSYLHFEIIPYGLQVIA